ncbi:MAG: apolipoprotein N-acyltransferase [Armatimonadetes bacterium]|nr:apolipoprotein N-acyltransferase [Armatimonadota bacterium]
MRSRKRTLTTRGSLGLCALSGGLLAASFPAPALWPLAWVALVPWLVALRLSPRWTAAAGSWLVGFIFFGALLYWLGLFGWTVWALACFILSLWHLGWGVGVRWIDRLTPSARLAGAAILWGGLEWARGLGNFGFTWGWLAYSQSPALSLLPVAGALGSIGLSVLIVLVNAAVAEFILGGARGEGCLFRIMRPGVVLAFVVVVVFGAQVWTERRDPPAGPEIRVAIVQGSAHGPLHAEQVNVPLTAEEERRGRDIYKRLTDEAATFRPALVVWPESVLTDAPAHDAVVAGLAARAARTADAWLLAGGPYYDTGGEVFNSAYLFAPTGNLVARYDKVQLVPFGEYVPWRERLPFIDRYHVRARDFQGGAVHHVLQAGTVSVGPVICFESIFPQISWQLAGRGAQLLVIITNDAWFGRTAAAAQHQQIAVLRAVETHRWVVRAASTGISCFISPEGRVTSEAGLFTEAVLTEDMKLAGEEAPCPGAGLVVAWAMLFLSCAVLVAPLTIPKSRRRPRRSPRRSAPRPERETEGR